MAVTRALWIGLWIGLAATTAHAQPAAATSDVLREGNTFALAGDWRGVSALVEPLLERSLATPDLCEAHRLAGIAAFFQQRGAAAEQHIVAYLRIELDGRLDPALYPPEVVAFFNDVASRHAAELRALRAPPPHRTWLLTLLPPIGQYQNGDHTKAYVLGGAMGALLIVNLTTYSYLRRWCNHSDGKAGGSLTCDEEGDHTRAAMALRPYNIASGIAFLLTYGYGVYDGIRGYRQQSREQAVQPFAARTNNGGVVGITGRF
jgi:hypothetical protein